jgi:hypothetical protein
MRTLTILVSAILVSMLIAVIPVLSAGNTMREESLTPKKDTCLLFAKNCQDNAYVLQQRINRLQREISRGTTAYTDNELYILMEKLDNANQALEFLNKDGV